MATSFPMALPHCPSGFVDRNILDATFTTPINDLAAQSPGSVYWVSRTTTLGLAINTPTRVVTYDGPSYSNGNITFAAGIFTVTQTGLYRWDATVRWPAATGRYLIYCYLNGVITYFGRSDGQLASAGASVSSAGGPQVMNAGDTLQLVLQSPDVGLTCNPWALGLERTG